MPPFQSQILCFRSLAPLWGRQGLWEVSQRERAALRTGKSVSKCSGDLTSIKDRCLGTLAELGAELSSGPHSLSSWVVGGFLQDRNREESFHRETAGKPDGVGAGQLSKDSGDPGDTAFGKSNGF